MASMRELFKKFCVFDESQDGDLEITCPLDIWSVQGKKETVEQEAFRYFLAYYADGEYDQLMKELDELGLL